MSEWTKYNRGNNSLVQRSYQGHAISTRYRACMIASIVVMTSSNRAEYMDDGAHDLFVFRNRWTFFYFLTARMHGPPC